MTNQDKDVLAVCLIAGFGLTFMALGLRWAVIGLLNLTRKD